jgi:hypothetical protein
VTAIKSIVTKSTVQAALALIVIVVASYLAVVKQIDGPTYFGLAVIVIGSYFRSSAPQSIDK